MKITISFAISMICLFFVGCISTEGGWKLSNELKYYEKLDIEGIDGKYEDTIKAQVIGNLKFPTILNSYDDMVTDLNRVISTASSWKLLQVSIPNNRRVEFHLLASEHSGNLIFWTSYYSRQEQKFIFGERKHRKNLNEVELELELLTADLPTTCIGNFGADAKVRYYTNYHSKTYTRGIYYSYGSEKASCTKLIRLHEVMSKLALLENM